MTCKILLTLLCISSCRQTVVATRFFPDFSLCSTRIFSSDSALLVQWYNTRLAAGILSSFLGVTFFGELITRLPEFGSRTCRFFWGGMKEKQRSRDGRLGGRSAPFCALISLKTGARSARARSAAKTN
jgi:hypothetical protein